MTVGAERSAVRAVGAAAAICLGLVALLPDRGAAQQPELIRAERIGHHVRLLAGDEFEGRGPGTRGGALTTAYLAAEAEALGLQPGAGDGFLQPVPIVRSRALGGSRLGIRIDGRERVLEPWRDYVPAPSSTASRSSARGRAVFAGHGIVAPGAGIDDYAGLDVRNRVVIVLADAPSRLAGAARAHHSDPALKARLAADRGALALLLVVTPGMEIRAPWPLLASSARSGVMSWLDVHGRPGDPIPLAGLAWLRATALETLLAGSGRVADALLARAETAPVDGFELDAEIEIVVRSARRRLVSHNVVATLEGSDRRLRNELIVLTAHWDHEGVGEAVGGDSIYNGALDNASGAAELLEIARAFARGPERPRRSIAFVWVTAEERGLVGSDYFARNPGLAGRIVANLNLDGSQLFHPARDVFALGAEESTLGGHFAEAARKLGLRVSPDPNPDAEAFLRSDHYSFVKRGIPALFLNLGFEARESGADPRGAYREFTRDHYHRPTDDLSLPFDWEAGAQIARVTYLTAWLAAEAEAAPAWLPESFYGRLFRGSAPRGPTPWTSPDFSGRPSGSSR